MKSGDMQRILLMKEQCEDVRDFVERFGNDFQLFSADKAFFKAVSLSVIQIGELSVGLSESFKDATRNRIPWHAMRNLRNICVHEYEKIDKLTIWEIAINDIPVLQKFCNEVTAQIKL